MTDGFWKVVTVVCLGALLFVIYSISTGKNFLETVIPGGGVVETAGLTIQKLERESQLATTRAYVQAVVRQKDEQVYGNAEVVRIVPATIHYAVNLAEIDRAKMEYDEMTQTLWVPLPDVRILSIDPDLEKAELIKSLDILRTESGIGNQLEQATEKMVRPTLERMGKTPEIVKVAKDQAVASVRQLLESSLEATGKRVHVKPYFKTEGKKGPADE
ncbi:MAG: DUF4230 domain-containing protein [Blastocatellia bacterium]|jgi:hypothetical protein|nr:DUF4230 domain-containing protein [Blastocatellia bacterium]